MTRLSIRIDLDGPRLNRKDAMLGPGMAELLQRIGQHGSIARAAASMQMSYRKAWLLVQAMQEAFGGPIVTTATGGVAGGGARLTELGEMLLKTYRAVEAKAAAAVADELKALTGLARRDESSRPQDAKPKKKARRTTGAP